MCAVFERHDPRDEARVQEVSAAKKDETSDKRKMKTIAQSPVFES